MLHFNNSMLDFLSPIYIIYAKSYQIYQTKLSGFGVTLGIIYYIYEAYLGLQKVNYQFFKVKDLNICVSKNTLFPICPSFFILQTILLEMYRYNVKVTMGSSCSRYCMFSHFPYDGIQPFTSFLAVYDNINFMSHNFVR